MPRTAGGGPHIVWPLIMIFFASFWWYFLMTGTTGGNQKTKLGTNLESLLAFPVSSQGLAAPGLISAISWAFSMKCWLAVGSLYHLEQYSASQRIRSHSWIQPSWTYNLSAVIHCEQGDRVPKISMAGWLAHVSHILGAHVWPCVTLIHSDLVLR